MDIEKITDYILNNLKFLGLNEIIKTENEEEIFNYYLHKNMNMLFNDILKIDANNLEVEKIASREYNKIIISYGDNSVVIQKKEHFLLIFDYKTNNILVVTDFGEGYIKNYILNKEMDIIGISGESFNYQKFTINGDEKTKEKDCILEPFNVRDDGFDYYNLKSNTDCEEKSLLLRIFESLKNNSIVTIPKDNKINNILMFLDKKEDSSRKRTLKK